jgi:hypothetical protein
VLRTIFRPREEDVTGKCKKLDNEELHNFVFSIKYYEDKQINEDAIRRS